MATVPQVKAFRVVRPAASVVRADGLDTPDAVVAALYDVLSGPAERVRERDWDLFRDLALPGARFIICRWPDGTGQPVPDLREWDVEGFIADARIAYAEEGFWEREIAGRTEIFGNVAHRFSSYESRVGTVESEPVGRGINSLQLVRWAGRWWISSIAWDVEGPDQPLPPDYQ
jgi:hypothetical protein